jgi:hypothetical protein
MPALEIKIMGGILKKIPKCAKPRYPRSHRSRGSSFLRILTREGNSMRFVLVLSLLISAGVFADDSMSLKDARQILQEADGISMHGPLNTPEVQAKVKAAMAVVNSPGVAYFSHNNECCAVVAGTNNTIHQCVSGDGFCHPSWDHTDCGGASDPCH